MTRERTQELLTLASATISDCQGECATLRTIKLPTGEHGKVFSAFVWPSSDLQFCHLKDHLHLLPCLITEGQFFSSVRCPKSTGAGVDVAADPRNMKIYIIKEPVQHPLVWF